MSVKVLKSFSIPELKCARELLAAEVHRLDAELASRSPHGLRVEVNTTTGNVHGFVHLVENMRDSSYFHSVELQVYEQDGLNSSLWSPTNTEELRRKYSL